MIDGSSTGGVSGGSTGPQDSLRAVLDSMIMSNIPYPAYDNETHWAMQYYVNSMDQGVHVMPGYENAKRFAMIDGQIASGNYLQAQGLSNSVFPSGVIENNWKAMNAFLINCGLNPGYAPSSSDTNTLKSIAAQCPLSGGSIVFRARAILNTYYNRIFEYPNDCPVIAGDASKAQAISNNLVSPQDKLVLYPNPNNGKLYISGFKGSEKSVFLEVSDITGHLLMKDSYTINNGLIELDLNLNNGIYLVKVIGNNGNSQTKKIILNR